MCRYKGNNCARPATLPAVPKLMIGIGIGLSRTILLFDLPFRRSDSTLQTSIIIMHLPAHLKQPVLNLSHRPAGPVHASVSGKNKLHKRFCRELLRNVQKPVATARVAAASYENATSAVAASHLNQVCILCPAQRGPSQTQLTDSQPAVCRSVTMYSQPCLAAALEMQPSLRQSCAI